MLAFNSYLKTNQTSHKKHIIYGSEFNTRWFPWDLAPLFFLTPALSYRYQCPSSPFIHRFLFLQTETIPVSSFVTTSTRKYRSAIRSDFNFHTVTDLLICSVITKLRGEGQYFPPRHGIQCLAHPSATGKTPKNTVTKCTTTWNKIFFSCPVF